jgi:DNA-binding MarR family transcriptional regulator
MVFYRGRPDRTTSERRPGVAERDRLDFLTDSWNRTRPDINIQPWQIWGRTTRLHELFLLAVGKALRRHSLTFSEFETLAALVLAGVPYRAYPNQIAQFNLLTSGGLANQLGRMEKDGLISREPGQDDKRSVVVQLTKTGLDRFNESVIEENKIEHELLTALTAEERAILSVLLRKLLLSIDQDRFGAP